MKVGWAYTDGSRRRHCFVGPDGNNMRLSLCHAWLFGGKTDGYSRDDSPENCQACKNALAKLRVTDRDFDASRER